ncbi:MAG: hypothetical protein ACXWCY_20400 [Burkholderiales bacterium]
MIALRNGFVVTHVSFLTPLALIIGFAFFTVGAHDMKRSIRTKKASCDEIAVAQEVKWHRQQTEAVELHSLTGLPRLFTTIADELAAESSHHNDVGAAGSALTCIAHVTTDPM